MGLEVDASSPPTSGLQSMKKRPAVPLFNWIVKENLGAFVSGECLKNLLAFAALGILCLPGVCPSLPGFIQQTYDAIDRNHMEMNWFPIFSPLSILMYSVSLYIHVSLVRMNLISQELDLQTGWED